MNIGIQVLFGHLLSFLLVCGLRIMAPEDAETLILEPVNMLHDIVKGN